MPPPAAPPPPAAAAPLPASPQAKAAEPCATSERCAEELRKMLNDQSRSWIGKPQTLDAHLTGTRQFAYLALMKVLKCPELATGLRDVQTGTLLRAPAGTYPAHVVEQIKDLDGHVMGELKKEIAARCPAR